MTDSTAERIHPPTPQRRQEARRQGQVARSQDLVSAGLLLGGLLLLLLLGGGLVEFFQQLAQRQWSGQAWLRADADFAVEQIRHLIFRLAVVLSPILLLLLAVAALVQLAQVGFLFLPQKLQWNVERIDPLRGLRRLFSRASAVRLSLGLVKALAIGVIAAWSVWSQRTQILQLGGLATADVAGAVTAVIWGICLRSAVALVLLALLDYAYQRWQHEQDLKMTPEELREEMRAQQGDPQVAARRREVQRNAAVQRLD